MPASRNHIQTYDLEANREVSHETRHAHSLDTLPAPDELACRRLLALLTSRGGGADAEAA